MGKTTTTLIAWAICLGIGCGCQQEDRHLYEGDGVLRLGMEISEKVDVVARSASQNEIPQEELKKKCRVRIYEGNKLVRKYGGWDQVPAEGIILPSRHYRTRITSGDSVAASFDKKFYEGNKEFDIRKGETTPVHVVCPIANAVVKVIFAPELTQYLSEGKVSVAVDTEEGTLEFPYEKTQQEPLLGYYTFPQDKNYLTCTFTATTISGQTIRQTNRIEEAKTSTLYTLTYTHHEVDHPEPPTDLGGGFFDLTVDETPLHTQEEEIIIYQRPVVSVQNAGETIGLQTPWTVEINAENVRPELLISTSSPMDSVKVSGSLLEFLQDTQADLMKEEVRQQFVEQGINIVQESEQRLRIAFQEYFYTHKLLEQEADFTLHCMVRDRQGKARDMEWHIAVSNSNISTVEIPYPYLIWADKATLYGKIREGRQPEGELTFRYRPKQGNGEWVNQVPAHSRPDSHEIISDEIKGLTPGTTYEYQLMEGNKASNVICEFTTEKALPLPNSGFENWSGGVPKLIFGNGEEMFWDSGNHGTKKVNANVTEPDYNIKQEGQASARLKSMFASMMGIGQFAAGNLFIGQYLETQMQGFTGHGVIGLGRAFTSRPLALRGYIRYQSGTVDRGGDKIANGTADQGIIYMALTDGEGEAYGDNKWSFIIRTKEQKFFSKDAPNVIAYGEQVWTASTGGEGMIPFEIRLNYDEKADGRQRIPNRLLMVAAASRYGDYFQGSTGSVMWLDKLELIYEENQLTKQ